jgi:hypothetical protein
VQCSSNGSSSSLMKVGSAHVTASRLSSVCSTVCSRTEVLVAAAGGAAAVVSRPHHGPAAATNTSCRAHTCQCVSDGPHQICASRQHQPRPIHMATAAAAGTTPNTKQSDCQRLMLLTCRCPSPLALHLQKAPTTAHPPTHQGSSCAAVTRSRRAAAQCGPRSGACHHPLLTREGSQICTTAAAADLGMILGSVAQV